MSIEQIKKEMLAYRDYYGGDIPFTDEIEKATTKKELSEIVEKHRRLLEDTLIDACKHLDSFKRRCKIPY